MMTFTDQTGYKVKLNGPPKRIISLVPSQSEFLWDLGLKQELVGITKFCVHPDEMYRSTERVGGTKTMSIDKIRVLQPDLIIGNKEENEQGVIEALRREFNVWLSDIYNLQDAYAMMTALGEITGKEKESAGLIDRISAQF
ncbi:MAG: ABC transporter substrate-binding protein, partial [Bacteroidia bacterium]